MVLKSKELQARLLLPVLTATQYIASLPSEAEVQLVAQSSLDGLAGKLGNRVNAEARLLFRECVVCNLKKVKELPRLTIIGAAAPYS